MNVYLFWILFLTLWAIVPLMIIKGRTDEIPKPKSLPEVKTKKKGWFNQKKSLFIQLFYKLVNFLKNQFNLKISNIFVSIKDFFTYMLVFIE